MLRMSKLTDFGTMVLAQLAASDLGWTTSGQVADATHLGPPTVSKLLKALVHAGLVVSSRGVQGGYALARPAEASLSLNVVATDTLSNTASTATPASRARSCSGMPSLS